MTLTFGTIDFTLSFEAKAYIDQSMYILPDFYQITRQTSNLARLAGFILPWGLTMTMEFVLTIALMAATFAHAKTSLTLQEARRPGVK